MCYKICLLLAACLLAAAAARADALASLEGQWVLQDGSAVVTVTDDGGSRQLSAKITALLHPDYTVVDPDGKPGSPRLDSQNRSAQQRDQTLLGLGIAQELKYEEGRWSGQIYDPRSGKTYRCSITLIADDFVQVRAYIGVSLLGRTMHWQRLEAYRRDVRAMLLLASQAAL
jgi:uncharacterized protein (DUF2147 family)